VTARGVKLRVGIAIAAMAVALPSLVAAGTSRVKNAEQHYQLKLSDTWTAIEIADNDEGRLAGYTHDSGAILAITKVAFPNIDARRTKTKKAFFARVEKGVEDAAKDYERLHRKQSKSGRVPLFDLTYRHERADGTSEVVYLRFIFHRTYSVSLAIAIPDEAYKANKKANAKLVKTFKPYWGK
jgi:hypothetical protein